MTVEDGVSAQELCFALFTQFEKPPAPNWVIVEVLHGLDLGEWMPLVVKSKHE